MSGIVAKEHPDLLVVVDAVGEVLLIGIEPEDLSLGARMSVVVRGALDDLVSILRVGELWRIEGQQRPQG